MKKVKLSFREKQFNEEMETHSLLIPIFKEVLEAYNSMSLPALSDNEFKELFRQPQAVIYDKMTMSKPIEVEGIKIAKNKAFDLFEKPTGFENLIGKINAVNSQQNSGWHLANTNLKDGDVVLNSTVHEKLTERHTVYATNEHHLKAYNFAKGVIDSAIEQFGDANVDIVTLVSKFINPSGGTGYGTNVPYSINYDNVITFRNSH